jgi:hypothetical protein
LLDFDKIAGSTRQTRQFFRRIPKAKRELVGHGAKEKRARGNSSRIRQDFNLRLQDKSTQDFTFSRCAWRAWLHGARSRILLCNLPAAAAARPIKSGARHAPRRAAAARRRSVKIDSSPRKER